MIMRLCPYDEIQTTEERCFTCNRPTIESRSAAWEVGEYGCWPESEWASLRENPATAMELLQTYGERVEEHNRMACYRAQADWFFYTTTASARLIFSTVA